MVIITKEDVLKSKEDRVHDYVKRIGGSIKFWRKDRGWNQEAFSKIIETSRSYVAKLETGGTGVSLNKIDDIAAALGVKVETLTVGVPGTLYMNIIQGYRVKHELTRGQFEYLYNLRPSNRDKPSKKQCETFLKLAQEVRI